MNISISWPVPERVLLVEISGTVAIDDYSVINQAVLDHMDSSRADKVHLIVDDQRVHLESANLMTILQKITFLKDPRLGWALAVGNASPFLISVTSVVAQVFKVNFRRCATLEDALTVLRAADPAVAQAMR